MPIVQGITQIWRHSVMVALGFIPLIFLPGSKTTRQTALKKIHIYIHIDIVQKAHILILYRRPTLLLFLRAMSSSVRFDKVPDVQVPVF